MGDCAALEKGIADFLKDFRRYYTIILFSYKTEEVFFRFLVVAENKVWAGGGYPPVQVPFEIRNKLLENSGDGIIFDIFVKII